jgi:hypothetical protein
MISVPGPEIPTRNGAATLPPPAGGAGETSPTADTAAWTDLSAVAETASSTGNRISERRRLGWRQRDGDDATGWVL